MEILSFYILFGSFFFYKDSLEKRNVFKYTLNTYWMHYLYNTRSAVCAKVLQTIIAQCSE